MLHSIHSSAKILPFYLKIVRVKCSGRTVAGRLNATYGVHRLLSTSSKGGSNLAASSASGEDGQSITLYERDSNRNNTPRASFLVSSVNCIYWIWYVFDFVPAVNSAPIQDLHVDPAYGFAGLGISILIQSAFTLYPTTLISKLAYQPVGSTTNQQQPQVLVWKHSLPFVQPSKNPTRIPLGNLYMDKTSSDTSKILGDYGGDMQQIRGHLGLGEKNGYIPLLLEIREEYEVLNSQLLLEVLLDPQRLRAIPARKSTGNTTVTARSHDNRKDPAIAKKRGNRGKKR